MSEKLLPCPFCGGKAGIGYYRDVCGDRYEVVCLTDGCILSSGSLGFHTQEEAKMAWNGRTHGTCRDCAHGRQTVFCDLSQKHHKPEFYCASYEERES